MTELIKSIEKNKRMLVGALAVAMLVIFVFCPVVDVVGKAKISGLELVFKSKNVGFSRIAGLLMLIVPVVVLLSDFITGVLKKLNGNRTGICFASGFVLTLILAGTIPSGVSLAWGSWIYMVLSIAGAAVSYIEKIKAEN